MSETTDTESEEHIPEEIPENSYIWQSGKNIQFPENPKTAIPSGDSLRTTPVDEITSYLSSTLPKFADRLETNHLDDLQEITGESKDMLEKDLELIRLLAEPDRLRGWLRTGKTDLGIYLENWQPADRYDVRVAPVGRGININAGHNIDAVILPELWRALTKNAVLHKMPGRDQLTLRVLAETYADNPHPVAETFAVAYWPGGHKELERNLYSADYVMAWGDDGTIESIQQRVPPTTRFISSHFEFGTYLVDAATQRNYGTELLQAIASDFSWGDQLLCFSPLLMVLEQCDATEQFLRDLADSIESYTKDYETGSIPDKERMKNIQSKRMARDRGELISDWENETTVILKDGLNADDLAAFHSFRFVEAHSVDQLEEAIVLVGSDPHLQEFVLTTTPERGDELRDLIATTNAKRITGPGEVAPSKPIPWDGKQIVLELTKWIPDER